MHPHLSFSGDDSIALIRGLHRCSLLTRKYILNSWLTMFSIPQRFVTSSVDLLSNAQVRKHDMMCSAAYSYGTKIRKLEIAQPLTVPPFIGPTLYPRGGTTTSHYKTLIFCTFSSVSPGFPPLLDNWESAFPANKRRSRHTVYMMGNGQLSSFWDDSNLTKN